MKTWHSYMTHVKMASTYRLRKKLLRRFAWLGDLFQMNGYKLKRMYEAPSTLSTLKGQYRFFLGRHPGATLFFQVGGFYEFYDRQAEIAIKVLGLKRVEATRGFRARCGFPVSLKERYLGRLIRLGLPIHIINEGEGWLTRVKKRRVVEGWMPMTAESDKWGVN
jgi:DNA mismatch repair ATPase MutS